MDARHHKQRTDLMVELVNMWASYEPNRHACTEAILLQSALVAEGELRRNLRCCGNGILGESS